MQDTKSDSSVNSVKLSFLILLCVTEDQYANALMHDSNLVFAVKLHKAPMRHRKISTSDPSAPNVSKSLACSVMDLMVEFIRSHLMKRFPQELYLHALFVIHRLLSYQKRSGYVAVSSSNHTMANFRSILGRFKVNFRSILGRF